MSVARSFEEIYFAADHAAQPGGGQPGAAQPGGGQERVSARAAFQEWLWGTIVLVDIRPSERRRVEGDLHPSLDALVVDRFLLEWRLDPRSETRLPQAAYDARVLVVGDELTAARAARELRDLGIARAAHVSGGFAAWRESGMPVSPINE